MKTLTQMGVRPVRCKINSPVVAALLIMLALLLLISACAENPAPVGDRKTTGSVTTPLATKQPTEAVQAQYKLTNLRIEVGKTDTEITTFVDIENTGTFGGSYKFECKVDGELVSTQTGFLNSGEKQSLRLPLVTGRLQVLYLNALRDDKPQQTHTINAGPLSINYTFKN